MGLEGTMVTTFWALYSLSMRWSQYLQRWIGSEGYMVGDEVEV